MFTGTFEVERIGQRAPDERPKVSPVPEDIRPDVETVSAEAIEPAEPEPIDEVKQPEWTATLAAEVAATAATGKSILDRFERGTLKYLTSIAGNKFRQVLLIDGPAVLGWEKWREIDARSFGGVMKAPMKRTPQAREMAAIGHLIAGALSEAALVCATSAHRVRDARDFTSALLKMLAPFLS